MQNKYWLKILYLVCSYLLFLQVVITSGRFWLLKLWGSSSQIQLWPFSSTTQLTAGQQFMWLLLVPTVVFSWLQLWYWRSWGRSHVWNRS